MLLYMREDASDSFSGLKSYDDGSIKLNSSKSISVLKSYDEEVPGLRLVLSNTNDKCMYYIR